MCASDLVLRGGTVVSPDAPEPGATALAVVGDRIEAVGSDADVSAHIGPDTRVVELRGRSVIPGINDAHIHLAEWAYLQPPLTLDIGSTTSLSDLRARLRDADRALPDDAWIVGGTWRENHLAELAELGRNPHRADLDEAVPSRPVALHHGSMHAVWANTAALDRAGITRATPDPDGGVIVRDRQGEPTGLLLDAAMAAVLDAVPKPSPDTRQDAIASAMARLNRLGVTSVTDPAVSPEMLRDYTALRRADRLTVRLNLLMHWNWPAPCSVEAMEQALRFSGAATGLGDDWLRIGGAKLFADGAPSHGTAWLHEPYLDGTNGRLTVVGDTEEDRCAELNKVVEHAHRHDLDLQIHVTGDRTADVVLDALIAAQTGHPRPRARHALIHGTLLTDSALARLAEHDIAVVTSSHLKATARGGMVPMIGQERWDRTFPVGSLLAAGVQVADSSDAPCAQPDWRQGVATFVGAAASPDAHVVEEQRVSLLQALQMWTTAGARLECAGAFKGAVRPGYLADFAVLGRDLLATPPHELGDLPVDLTVAGGRVVHDVEAV